MLHHPIKDGLFLTSAGVLGSMIAVLKPWQEQLEWSARMLLLLFSIASVIVGLVVTLRKKRK